MTQIKHLLSCQSAQSGERWRIKVEPTARRVRVIFNGITLADSRKVKVLHETGHLPVYYFPPEDVQVALFERSDYRTTCSRKGDAVHWHVKAGDRITKNAVWSYEHASEGAYEIEGYFSFYWDKVDHWFEEEEEIFVHPRDPYKRIDAIKSSRHIRIELNGQTIAESRRPVIVFETGVPVRYYLPKEDIFQNVLEESSSRTSCPYKGTASYWSARINGQVHKDIVWSYIQPIPEIAKIAGLFSFYNERVDVYVDGKKESDQKWFRSALDFYNRNELPSSE